MSKFQACLFDMDGLLLDSERLARDSFIATVSEMYPGWSTQKTESRFLTLVGGSSQDTTRQLQAWTDGQEESFKHVWCERFGALCKDGIPVKAHVHAMLSHLNERGMTMAVVTSTHGAHARENLQKAGLLPFFAHVMAGDEVSANKPDPAPYLEASEHLGVDPTKCAAFEDSDRGTTAAWRAGCTTVQIPDLRPIGQAFPNFGHRICPDMRAAFVELGLWSP